MALDLEAKEVLMLLGIAGGIFTGGWSISKWIGGKDIESKQTEKTATKCDAHQLTLSDFRTKLDSTSLIANEAKEIALKAFSRAGEIDKLTVSLTEQIKAGQADMERIDDDIRRNMSEVKSMLSENTKAVQDLTKTVIASLGDRK